MRYPLDTWTGRVVTAVGIVGLFAAFRETGDEAIGGLVGAVAQDLGNLTALFALVFLSIGQYQYRDRYGHLPRPPKQAWWRTVILWVWLIVVAYLGFGVAVFLAALAIEAALLVSG